MIEIKIPREEFNNILYYELKKMLKTLGAKARVTVVEDMLIPLEYRTVRGEPVVAEEHYVKESL
jgi:hypothetical protein